MYSEDSIAFSIFVFIAAFVTFFLVVIGVWMWRVRKQQNISLGRDQWEDDFPGSDFDHLAPIQQGDEVQEKVFYLTYFPAPREESIFKDNPEFFSDVRLLFNSDSFLKQCFQQRTEHVLNFDHQQITSKTDIQYIVSEFFNEPEIAGAILFRWGGLILDKVREKQFKANTSYLEFYIRRLQEGQPTQYAQVTIFSPRTIAWDHASFTGFISPVKEIPHENDLRSID